MSNSVAQPLSCTMPPATQPRRVRTASSPACGFSASQFAQDARQIVAEAQRRGRADSQRYEGSLEVTGANGKVTNKSWQSLRLGSYGHSKAIIRFTAPAEVKGRGAAGRQSSRTARRTSGCGRRPSAATAASPCRTAPRASSAPISASRIWKSATSTSSITASRRRVHRWRRPAGASKRRPRQGKVSQYTSSRVWIRKDNYVPAQYENYVKDQLVRRLHQTDIRNVQGIWTPCAAGDDRSRPQQPHRSAHREAGIQRPHEGRRFHRAGAAAGAVARGRVNRTDRCGGFP